MTRWVAMAALVVVASSFAAGDGPTDELTPEQHKELEAKAAALKKEGDEFFKARKLPEAAERLEAVLKLRKQLYPESKNPAGHPDLAEGMDGLALVFKAQGRLADVERLRRDALEMRRRLYPPDRDPAGHPLLADSLAFLGDALLAQDKPGAAEPLYGDSVEMLRRVYPADQYPAGHRALAYALNQLGYSRELQRKFGAAVDAYQEALAIRRKLYSEKEYPKGHPDLAISLVNLADGILGQGKPAAAEPLFREAADMRRRLCPEGVTHVSADGPDRVAFRTLGYALNQVGYACHLQGKHAAAEEAHREALTVRRKLFPVTEYPAGHTQSTLSLDNLAEALRQQGRLSEAEPFYRESMAMRRTLNPNKDNLDLVMSMNNLAYIIDAQGRPADAEPLYREILANSRGLFSTDKFPNGHRYLAVTVNNLGLALRAEGKMVAAEEELRKALEMFRKLYPVDKLPNGHIEIGQCLNNLSAVLDGQGRTADAEPLLRDALAMFRRLFPADKFPAGHAEMAQMLTNLAKLVEAQGRPAEAEPLAREAVALCQRLYPPDTFPTGAAQLALSLNNLAMTLNALGRAAEAESSARAALAMFRRLYPPEKSPAGHPHLAHCMANVATLLCIQGRPVDAEPFVHDALTMYRMLTEEYAKTKSDGDALTLLGTFPLARDMYLSLQTDRTDAADFVYSVVWPSRAAVTRAMERKHLAARAVSAPEFRMLWDELTSLRRRRAELVLAPMPRHRDDRQARDDLLEKWASRIAELDRDIRTKFPDLDRADAIARSTPAELQAVLSPSVTFIDLLRYTRLTYDPTKPGKTGETRTDSYLAFVVTKQKIARVDLGPAGPIETAIKGWHAATAGSGSDGDHPATLRKLVWDKLTPQLPVGVETVYLAPDQALAGIPWVALPGAKPGAVLLEDHAIVIVPHGQFLLGQLTAPASTPAAGGLLVVGGVNYGEPPDGPPAPAKPKDTTPTRSGSNSWKYLDGTAREAERVAALAAAGKLAVTALAGAAASSDAIREKLPKARVAHLATHGFFADPNFRSVLQVDPKLFETRGSERVGAGALSPLVLSGLVFAGANRPETPGRGLVTGEALVGLDLSGMDLAVLSACDTGLGDVAGGEGVFGLQKAFHLAGCRNVVASLWKVDDDATAALMGLFYRHLWVDKLPPVEALRRAQLTLFRNPGLIPTLAKKRGVDFTETELPAVTARVPATGLTAKTSQWAAFVLSGVGR